MSEKGLNSWLPNSSSRGPEIWRVSEQWSGNFQSCITCYVPFWNISQEPQTPSFSPVHLTASTPLTLSSFTLSRISGHFDSASSSLYPLICVQTSHSHLPCAVHSRAKLIVKECSVVCLLYILSLASDLRVQIQNNLSEFPVLYH